MVVCRFYQQGNCRFGDNCKFEHPNNAPVANENRFSALQNDRPPSRNSNAYRNDGPAPRNNNAYQNDRPPTRSNNAFQGGSSSTPALPYMLDKKGIITDLTTEIPMWILSAYGPGRGAPEQLFGGPLREQSFEEMRVLHYMAAASGNPQAEIQHANKLYETSEQQMQAALSNVDAAIDFVIKAENQHPNRIDICKGGQSNGPGFSQSGLAAQRTPTTSAFGAPSQPAQGFGAPSVGYGQPAVVGQLPIPFGARASVPAFGAPSLPSAGSFGQPSALGQQPNTFGGNAPASAPAFGAPSMGAGGAFGQPSALGQKPNPFGAPSGGTAGPFATTINATPSPFSQPAAANPFGAPSQPAAPNPFGAPSQTNPANPFSQQPQQQQPSNQFTSQAPPNPLARVSASPFGVPSPAKTPFGAAPQAPNPFGGNATTQPNPFSAPSTTQPAANGFSAPPSFSNGASNLSYSGPTTGSFPQHLQSNDYIKKDSRGQLMSFKGKRVEYRNDEPGFTNQAGVWEKIWFPDGQPDMNKDAVMTEEAYDDETKEAYLYALQHGSFKDGMMPLVPPKTEWSLWDF